MSTARRLVHITFGELRLENEVGSSTALGTGA